MTPVHVDREFDICTPIFESNSKMKWLLVARVVASYILKVYVVYVLNVCDPRIKLAVIVPALHTSAVIIRRSPRINMFLNLNIFIFHIK